MTASENILVVDDDPRICRLLTRYLQGEGYSVSTASNGEEMRRSIAAEPPNLVILDLMLPDEDGFTLLRELRSQSELAVIMLTGKTDTTDKVVGLELGADDYITKPFDSRELLARVHSVLRRASYNDIHGEKAEYAIARFAGWQLDLLGRELTSPAGEKIHLTTHEWEMLSTFVTHPNCALTRDQLLRLTTGRDWSPYDRSVDMLVSNLRAKIEHDPKHPTLIHTIRGVGYKFTGRVEFQ